MSRTGNNAVRALVTMGLTDLETRVVKATYPDDDPPKPKHVDALISYTHEYNIVPLLEKQMENGKWNVIFKTLVVIHRCAMEGDERFVKNISRRPQLMQLATWNDYTIDGRMHTKFIKAYADYLSDKFYVYKLIGTSIERRTPNDSKQWASQLSLDMLCKSLPALVQQFDKLLRCYPYSHDDANHPISAAAMALLVKDAFRIYSVLTVQLLQVLEHLDSLSLEQSKLLSACAEHFTAQNERFKSWSEKLTRLHLIQSRLLPRFDAIPESFKEILDERVIALEGGAVPKNERKKKGQHKSREEEHIDEDNDVKQRNADVDEQQSRQEFTEAGDDEQRRLRERKEKRKKKKKQNAREQQTDVQSTAVTSAASQSQASANFFDDDLANILGTAHPFAQPPPYPGIKQQPSEALSFFQSNSMMPTSQQHQPHLSLPSSTSHANHSDMFAINSSAGVPFAPSSSDPFSFGQFGNGVQPTMSMLNQDKNPASGFGVTNLNMAQAQPIPGHNAFANGQNAFANGQNVFANGQNVFATGPNLNQFPFQQQPVLSGTYPPQQMPYYFPPNGATVPGSWHAPSSPLQPHTAQH